MLEKLAKSKIILFLVVQLSYLSFVLIPIRSTVYIYSLIPAPAAITTTLGVTALIPSLARAQELNLEALRSKVGSIRTTTDNSTEDGVEVKKVEDFAFGTEEDRAYGGMIETEKWDHATVKQKGMAFESRLKTDSNTTESRVYKLLQKGANDEDFHTRNRDYQDVGDKITLVNTEDTTYADGYSELSEQIEEGLVCRSEVVKEAVYEDRVIEKNYQCSEATGDAWIQGECTIERDIRVPMIAGEGVSYTVTDSGYTRKFEMSGDGEYTFKIEDLEQFTDSFEISFDPSGYDDIAEFEYVLNGHSKSFPKADVLSGKVTLAKSLFVEGENTLKVRVHPLGYSGKEDTQYCTKDELVTIGVGGGYEAWHEYERCTGPRKDPSCTYWWKQFWTRDILACSNKKIHIFRAFHTFLPEETNAQTDDDDDWRLSTLDSVLTEWMDEKGASVCNEFNRSNQTAYKYSDFSYESYGNQRWRGCISVDAFTDESLIYYFPERDPDRSWRRTKYYHFLSDEGGYPYSSVGGTRKRTDGNANEVVNYKKPLFCEGATCTYKGKTFSLAYSEPISSKLTASAPSFFVKNYKESVENCSTGSNVTIQRTDGLYVSGLSLKFFDEDYQADGISNSKWECLDSGSDRQVGVLSESKAYASEIGKAVPQFFEGINGINESICYKARARNPNVDISTAPLCSSGSLECYVGASSTAEAHSGTANQSDGSVRDFLQRGVECSAYKSDESCKLKNRVCQIYSPFNNECLRYEAEYTCEETESKLVSPSEVKQVCEAQIPCLAGEDEFCTYTDESSSSFEEAAINMSISTMARGDQDCFGETADSCQIFRGEQKECRSSILYSSSNSCCKDPGTVSTMDYVHALYAAYKIKYVETTVDSLANTYVINPVNDWVVDPIKQGAQQLWGSFKDMIISPENADKIVGDNLVSATGTFARQQGTDIAAAANVKTEGWSFFAEASQAAMKWGNENLGSLGEWMFDSVLTDPVSGQVVGTTTSGAINVGGVEYASKEAYEEATGNVLSETFSASQGLQSLFGSIMLAYQIYSIAKLVYEVLTACNSGEIETASDLAVGNCTFMKKECTNETWFGCEEETNYYCCFKSPLARIVHEQSIKTNQHPFVSREEHYDFGLCRGFWFSELQQVDFNAEGFSLDEWVSLLVESDKIPDENELDEFFNEEHLTKSVARAYDNEDEVEVASERAKDIVTQMDDVEEIRRKQREYLLAKENYDVSKRNCGYVHDMAGGISYDGIEEFSQYAGGTEVMIKECYPDKEGNTYPHFFRECAPRITPIYNDEGDKIDEDITRLWTVGFYTSSGSEMILESCTDNADVGRAALAGELNWEHCGYYDNIANGYSLGKRRLVNEEGDEIIGCGVQPQSPTYTHYDAPCGVAVGELSLDGFSRQLWQVAYLGYNDEVVGVTACEERQNYPVYPHKYSACGYKHDELGMISFKTYELGYDNFEGEFTAIDECEVIDTSEEYEHNFRNDMCDSYHHDSDNDVSYRLTQQIVYIPEEGIIPIGECKYVKDETTKGDKFNHQFENCGWVTDMDAMTASEKLQRYVTIDGERIDLGSCEVIDGHSQVIDVVKRDCGSYSHQSGYSTINQKYSYFNPSTQSYVDVSECSADIALSFDHRSEKCGTRKVCVIDSWFGCLHKETVNKYQKYFTRWDKGGEKVVVPGTCR